MKTRRHVGALAVLALGISLSGCGYNTIQELDEKTNQQKANIETELMRRNDLIPNLVATVKAAGAQEKVKIPADTSITANVGIGPRSEGGFGLDVALRISLPGMEKAQAEALVEKAHHICPYSNATRGNVDVRLTVV